MRPSTHRSSQEALSAAKPSARQRPIKVVINDKVNLIAEG